MKRIFTILCALAIVMAGSATALAAEPEAGQSASYYPISVEEYTYGDFDELRINKTYQLSLSDDPSLIPTEDFIRNGRRYYLLDMTRKDEVGVDIQTHTETVTKDIANELIRRGVRDRKGNVHWTTREIYYWLSNERDLSGRPSSASKEVGET